MYVVKDLYLEYKKILTTQPKKRNNAIKIWANDV